MATECAKRPGSNECQHITDSIVVRNYGDIGKVVEAIEVCTGCPRKMECLRRVSVIVWIEQMSEALGLNDINN